jgi:hypothetical protein
LADDPRDKIAVGAVLEDGSVEWFDEVPAPNTYIFVHHYTQKQIDRMNERAERYRPLFEAAHADLEKWKKEYAVEQLVGRHRWQAKDGAEYAANHYGSELAGDVGNCKICDQDMFASIHISPLDPDPVR